MQAWSLESSLVQANISGKDYSSLVLLQHSNGERDSPAQGFQLIGCNFNSTLFDKHAYILVEPLPKSRTGKKSLISVFLPK